jgi:hypothetical protein
MRALKDADGVTLPSSLPQESPLRKCNPKHLPQNIVAAHRASCKRTSFTIAIHMVSTISGARNVMQGGICAIPRETQPQKRAQIRRIFSVARLPCSA